MTADYFLGLSTIAQLKVFKGCAFTFFFIFYSLFTYPNACVFEKRGPRLLEKSTSKTYISLTMRRSGSLGGGGWVDRQWVDLFDQLLGLIGCVCWV